MSRPTEVYYRNGFTLKLSCGAARQGNLEDSVRVYMAQLDTGFPGQGYGSIVWKANVVTQVNKAIFGYAYLWFSDIRPANILMGLNPDGSKRVKCFPDPNWKAPSEPRPEVSDDEESKDDDDEEDDDDGFVQKGKGKIMWGDTTSKKDKKQARQRDRELRRTEIDSLYTQPMLEKAEPPIAKLPVFTYDSEQIALATDLMLKQAEAEAEEGLPQRDIIVPSKGSFICEFAGVRAVGKADVIPGRLGCVEVPIWVTEEMLRPLFAPFNTADAISVKGVRIEYPTFQFKPKNGPTRCGEKCNMVTTQFCIVGNAIHDSSFALHFVRKFELEHPGDRADFDRAAANGEDTADIKVRKCLLIFDHWKANPERRPAAASGGGYRGNNSSGYRGNNSSGYRGNGSSNSSSSSGSSSGGIRVAPNTRFYNLSGKK